MKLVQSFGSTWGRIQPEGSQRAVFFNGPSVAPEVGFADLREGQQVEFDEEPDRVNGSHAVRVSPIMDPLGTRSS